MKYIICKKKKDIKYDSKQKNVRQANQNNKNKSKFWKELILGSFETSCAKDINLNYFILASGIIFGQGQK